MKKIYKMTEDQVANLITNRKNSVSETSSPKETKKKYKITEEQLKRIFSELGKKVVGEMDNYNYPMGSDTSDAPWNQDDGNVDKVNRLVVILLVLRQLIVSTY